MVHTSRINFNKLQTRIRYAFKHKDLLVLVVTDASKGVSNNERLAALGIEILQFLIIEALYRNYPDFDEGRISGITHRICSNYSILDHAGAIGLRIYAYRLRVNRLGEGLATAFKALVAATYIDGGLEAVRTFVLTEFEADLKNTTPALHYQAELRVFMKEHFNREPTYDDLSTDGAKAAGLFTYIVVNDGTTLGTGTGHDAPEARTNAARNALKYLKRFFPEDLDG
jgi:ribonuclease-3